MNSKFFTLAEAFVAVARTKSITQAAAELRTSKSSISQKLTELEAHLDVTLLHRTTRKIELTPAGHQALRQCATAVDAISQAGFDTGFSHSNKDDISGVVTLSGSNSYLTKAVIPALKTFLALYPNIKLNLIGSDRPINLRDNNIDLKIRIGDLGVEDAKATRLQPLKRLLCASPDLHPETRRMTHPKQLPSLPLITREQEPPQWRFQKNSSTHIVEVSNNQLIVNSIELCRESVKNGLGIAVLADLIVADDIQNNTLSHLLPGWKIPDIQVHLLARRSRTNRPAVMLLHQHLTTQLGVLTD